jgi:hypothetical protein
MVTHRGGKGRVNRRIVNKDLLLIPEKQNCIFTISTNEEDGKYEISYQ